MPPFRRGGYHRQPPSTHFFGPVAGVGEMLGPRRPPRAGLGEIANQALSPRKPARMGFLGWIISLFTGGLRKRRPPQQPPNAAQMAQMEQMQMAEEQQ